MSKNLFDSSFLAFVSKFGGSKFPSIDRGSALTKKDSRKKKRNRLASGNGGHENPHTKMRRNLAARSNAINRDRIKRWKH